MSADLPPVDDGFRLREYLGILRVRKWSIVAITLLATTGAWAYASLQEPVYQSVARVQATNATAAIVSQNPAAAQPSMPTEQALVGSETVSKCAWLLMNARSSDADTLCGTDGKVTDEVTSALPQAWFHKDLSVSIAEGTTILGIAFRNNSRPVALAGAESYALSYVWSKTFTANAKVAQLRAPLLKQQHSLEKEIAFANEALIRAAGKGKAQTAAALSAQLSALNNSLQVVNQQLIDISPAKIDPPGIVVDAALPSGPVSPNKPLIVTFGFLAGLGFGGGLAFAREQLDDRLRGRADLERAVGAPVFAVIPRVPGWKKRTEVKLVTVDQPKSAVAESYRTLRTSILFAAAQKGVRNIMVVSPTAGEGKTTTAANLAVVLADAGKRVILISCDLRKPRIHSFFGLSNEIGLSNVLAGESKPGEALQHPERENLRVMSGGPVPGSPAELLQSEQMGELIEQFGRVSDFVVLDTAPMLLVADALALAPLVDGVLFVADAEETSRGAVSQARDELEQLDASIIGAVLNNFDPAKAKAYASGYGGGYYYYGKRGYYRAYGHEETPESNGEVLDATGERRSS